MTPAAAEMPKTVLSPTPREFSSKLAKKSPEGQKFVKKYKEADYSDRFQSDYRKSNVVNPIVEVR